MRAAGRALSAAIALAPDQDGETAQSQGLVPRQHVRMDVFPKLTGVTAVLPGESARAGRGASA